MFLVGTLMMLIINIINFVRLLNVVDSPFVSEGVIMISAFQTIAWLLLFISSFTGMSSYKTFK